MVSISIRSLNKRFGETVALDSVNLKIEPGEMFFLLGPSGCGKTTLLRHIAGFYTPDSGKILFDAKDVTHVAAHKRNTAMMFQSYALWPHMSVAQNVAFGLEQRKVDPENIERRVAEALDMVRLRKQAGRKINQLSGGQQQRVALARALVVRPECLLLDEPLSNLDARLRLDMRTEIRRICKEFGLTTVYVTHDQKEALAIADRLAILDEGKVVQAGTPRQIYRFPFTTRVASFLGETNMIRGVIDGEAGTEKLWSVKTDFGEFWGRLTEKSWEPKSGERVTICIRPEAMRLADYAGARNTIAGRLHHYMYLGDTAQTVLNAAEGQEVRITELHPTGRAPDQDTELFASCTPQDTLILRR
ncbi:MAG: iron(III) transport system ATP-binding protein [Verrucomicrobiales bacterium]|jgi:iron(III) transport system ATP-binding protein